MSCGNCIRPRQAFDAEYAMEMLPRMTTALAEKLNLEGEVGGGFCVLDKKTREYAIPPTIEGVVAEDKQAECLELCAEAAERLRVNNENEVEEAKHWLSWESRDPGSNKWGGAIDDGQYIWSFRGISEEADEALMLMTAHMCARISNGSPEFYAKTSGNRIILEGNLFWYPV